MSAMINYFVLLETVPPRAIKSYLRSERDLFCKIDFIYGKILLILDIIIIAYIIILNVTANLAIS